MAQKACNHFIDLVAPPSIASSHTFLPLGDVCSSLEMREGKVEARGVLGRARFVEHIV